jgi:hypothetical protein
MQEKGNFGRCADESSGHDIYFVFFKSTV